MSEWIVLLLIGLVIIAGIVIYNRLVTDTQRVKSGWSDIEVQLKRRHDLIPKLVVAVKQYASYEQATLEAVTALRSDARQANAVGDQAALETRLSTSLISIYALQESYPELNSNGNFLKLQESLCDTENRIALARGYYNEIVSHYNIRLQVIPDRFISALAMMKPRQYITADDFQRAPVRVNLAE